MQYPESLRNAAEELAENFDRKKLAKAAGTISLRYREEKGNGSELAGTDTETAAYAAVRMPATFAAVSSALEHALRHYSGNIVSAADAGAGTGAAGWAAAELIGELEELHCFERTDSMSRLGKKLMEEAEIPVNAFWHHLDIVRDELPRSFDLITAGYVLNELAEKDRERAVMQLWEKTDGMLLIVEPGTKKGYGNIIQARRLLLENGAQIAYPCPDITECPLTDDDWCHFTARTARSKLHKQLKGGDVPYEDEKFSCIAAVRSCAAPCTGRILRHPQISAGMIELHVCTNAGISDMKVTKSSKQFKTARKAECGDAFNS